MGTWKQLNYNPESVPEHKLATFGLLHNSPPQEDTTFCKVNRPVIGLLEILLPKTLGLSGLSLSRLATCQLVWQLVSLATVLRPFFFFSLKVSTSRGHQALFRTLLGRVRVCITSSSFLGLLPFVWRKPFLMVSPDFLERDM